MNIADYRIVEKIADGATAAVFKASHLESGHVVAIKQMHKALVRDESSRLRFLREFDAVGDLNHPNIVNVLHVDNTDEGIPYLIMEYAQGDTLDDVLARQDLSRDEALRCIAQIILAVEHAHGHGVIHRDLKPENIILSRGDKGYEAKVLDFGAAKLQLELGVKITKIGVTLGSPAYMSPEQASGKADIDPRSDVFSVASLAYEMILRRKAFGGDTLHEILQKVVFEEPLDPSSISPDLPVALDLAFARAWTKDKTIRTSSAREFGNELLGALFEKPPSLEDLSANGVPFVPQTSAPRSYSPGAAKNQADFAEPAQGPSLEELDSFLPKAPKPTTLFIAFALVFACFIVCALLLF